MKLQQIECLPAGDKEQTEKCLSTGDRGLQQNNALELQQIYCLPPSRMEAVEL